MEIGRSRERRRCEPHSRISSWEKKLDSSVSGVERKNEPLTDYSCEHLESRWSLDKPWTDIRPNSTDSNRFVEARSHSLIASLTIKLRWILNCYSSTRDVITFKHWMIFDWIYLYIYISLNILNIFLFRTIERKNVQSISIIHIFDKVISKDC